MTGGGDWSHGIVMTDLGGGFDLPLERCKMQMLLSL